MEEKNLQIQEKRELATQSETTRDVPVYIPAVDIYETERELTLLADMPGVPLEKIDIDLNDDQLTIRGTVDIEKEQGYGAVAGVSHGGLLSTVHRIQRH